jgi:hypothetical protein
MKTKSENEVPRKPLHLSLHKETLRALEESSLKQVGGGAYTLSCNVQNICHF